MLSIDISSFRKSARSHQLKSPTVKVLVAQVLRDLVALHSADIMHGSKQHQIEKLFLTHLKLDNVLFRGEIAPKVIQKLLKDAPAVDGEIESSDERYPTIRSPIASTRTGMIVELYFVQLVAYIYLIPSRPPTWPAPACGLGLA